MVTADESIFTALEGYLDTVGFCVWLPQTPMRNFVLGRVWKVQFLTLAAIAFPPFMFSANKTKIRFILCHIGPSSLVSVFPCEANAYSFA